MTLTIDVNAWGWPQYILFVLSIVTLASQVILHGKSRGEYNGWAAMADFLVGILLLSAGGFYS
jgi:hypothetical protein